MTFQIIVQRGEVPSSRMERSLVFMKREGFPMPLDTTPPPSPTLLSKFLIGEESKQVSS